MSWSPLQWQAHVNAFLTLHYRRVQGHYQRVADLMNGDAGLEAFGSDGVAYQSYCDVDTDKQSDRTRKQKRKITTDLGKLKTNSDFWMATLQDLKLARWVLMVPSYSDKDVLKHGRKKAAELRKLQLPFLADGFQFSIETEDDYPLACRELAQAGAAPLPIDSAEVDANDIQSYTTKYPSEFEQMRRKLEEGQLLDADDELVFDLVEWLLRRDHALEKLREIDPNLRERLDERRFTLARKVKTSSLLDTAPAELRISSLLENLRDEFLQTVPGLKVSTVDELAYGQIASWLAECPLKFRGK